MCCHPKPQPRPINLSAGARKVGSLNCSLNTVVYPWPPSCGTAAPRATTAPVETPLVHGMERLMAPPLSSALRTHSPSNWVPLLRSSAVSSLLHSVMPTSAGMDQAAPCSATAAVRVRCSATACLSNSSPQPTQHTKSRLLALGATTSPVACPNTHQTLTL